MGINTVLHRPHSPDFASCDFWLFPKLRGCRHETTEEMKEAVTKVIGTVTQEDFHPAFQKLLERYKCITAGGEYFDGDESFMCGVSIKVPIREKSGNLLKAPRIYLFIYSFVCETFLGSIYFIISRQPFIRIFALKIYNINTIAICKSNAVEKLILYFLKMSF